LAYRLPEEGRVLKEHAGATKRLYHCVRWTYVGFINEKFSHNEQHK